MQVVNSAQEQKDQVLLLLFYFFYWVGGGDCMILSENCNKDSWSTYPVPGTLPHFIFMY